MTPEQEAEMVKLLSEATPRPWRPREQREDPPIDENTGLLLGEDGKPI